MTNRFWRLFICAICGRTIAECAPPGATGIPTIEEIHSCAVCAQKDRRHG